MRSMRWISITALALLASGAAGQTDPRVTRPEPREAVERALPLLQQSAGEFVKQRTCLSCHHNILPILTLHMAKDRGFNVDLAVVSAVEERTFRELRNANSLDDAIQGTTFEDPTPNDSFLLMAAEAAHVETTLPLAVYAKHLLGWQRDGHWVTSDFRPPHS